MLHGLTGAIRTRLIAGLVATVLFLSYAPTANAAPTLTANPTEVKFLKTSDIRSTTLAWSSGNANSVDVHVKVDNGIFAPTGLSGLSGNSDYPYLQYGKTYTFKLVYTDGGILIGSPWVVVTTKLQPLQIDVGCAIQCITKAEVTPHGTYADFHVETNEPATFVVQAIAAAPNADGTCKGAPLAGTLWKTTKSTTFDGQMQHLDANTQHCYTVTAKDASGKEAKKHATFKTHKRTVIVTIDKIFVIDDSDGGGPGELSFNVHVHKTSEYYAVPETSYLSGSEIVLNKVVTVPNAPTSVKVEVFGSDQDLPNGPEMALAGMALDVGGPGGPGENFANKTYDMTSVPYGGGDLKFTVHGKYTVVYGP